jgi:hypothetical protein
VIDALKSILGFFETLLDFVGFLIEGLAELLLMIPSAFTMLTYSIGFLPSVLLAFASIAITISIVFLIVNR